MKGPFETLQAALTAASEGEAIMARDERHAPNAAWCVMTQHEADIEYAKGWWRVWVHWQNKEVAQ